MASTGGPDRIVVTEQHLLRVEREHPVKPAPLLPHPRMPPKHVARPRAEAGTQLHGRRLKPGPGSWTWSRRARAGRLGSDGSGRTARAGGLGVGRPGSEARARTAGVSAKAPGTPDLSAKADNAKLNQRPFDGRRPSALTATPHKALNGRNVGVWGLGPQVRMRNDPVRAFRERGQPECSPEGIRTLATALRGRRPRPLDDGARTCCTAVLHPLSRLRRAELYQKSSAAPLREWLRWGTRTRT